MGRLEDLYSQCRERGLVMADRDLAELYSYLRCFRRTYVACENEADELLDAVRGLYMLQTGITDADEAFAELGNPRSAGRKKSITQEQCQKARELHSSGMSIREIAANTGLSRSSVQRILQDTVSQN